MAALVRLTAVDKVEQYVYVVCVCVEENNNKKNKITATPVDGGFRAVFARDGWTREGVTSRTVAAQVVDDVL